jgi:DNA-binding NarL/FixJ family response regulator
LIEFFLSSCDVAEEAMVVSAQQSVNRINELRQDAERELIEELVRHLIEVVIAYEPAIKAQQEYEEIILDINVDGVRYLLIRSPSSSPPLDSLSPREREIVRLVAKGYNNKTIAAALRISSWTVCTHLRRTFAKLGVTSRAAMVARLLEEHKAWGQIVHEQRMPTRQPQIRQETRKVSLLTVRKRQPA